MRKLIVCNLMSLDGYYEGPGKDVMVLFDYRKEAYPADESFDVYNAERLRAAMREQGTSEPRGHSQARATGVRNAFTGHLRLLPGDDQCGGRGQPSRRRGSSTPRPMTRMATRTCLATESDRTAGTAPRVTHQAVARTVMVVRVIWCSRSRRRCEPPSSPRPTRSSST